MRKGAVLSIISGIIVIAGAFLLTRFTVGQAGA